MTPDPHPPLPDCDCHRCAIEERDRLRQDAMRYRWLRQYMVTSYLASGTTEKLDAEIDAAMKEP